MTTLYAELPHRRTRQILADVLMLAWVVGWVAIAGLVHEATMTLAAPGRVLQDAGVEFQDRMLGAGDRVDGLPLLEDRLAAPLREVSGVGGDIAAAGTGLVTAAERLALIAGVTTALIPITIVGALWLALRWRWVRRATVTARFIRSGADLDLVALRALTHQPLTALARVGEDPVGAWRRGDRTVVTALAELELADIGLRPPRGP